jgi:hypothetical protein
MNARWTCSWPPAADHDRVDRYRYTLLAPAASLTGAQAGIATDGVHTKARFKISHPCDHELLDAERS